MKIEKLSLRQILIEVVKKYNLRSVLTALAFFMGCSDRVRTHETNSHFFRRILQKLGLCHVNVIFLWRKRNNGAI